MMFSVRIVNTDFYIATPVPDLDVCNSAFRETATSKVPVIRIYGATPGGQKTCLHVHGVFPYIYVPYDGTQPTEKYVKQFAISVDFAVQVALGKASSSRQHVYEISVVKGIPFYGYHEGERDFLKISLYNPFLVTRVVSLLQNGAVMNKVFQPYEAHIPYLLQFFMDYNLYGMNLLHVSAVKFRNPVGLVDGEAETVKSSSEIQRSKSPEASTCVGTPRQIWNDDTVPRDWMLESEVERVSFCELEVDVRASDILNKNEIGVNIGTNPGLAAIWEDEQQRRRDANESSQISAPSSQERGLIQETETERKFKERIKEIIDERDLLIQSQMKKLGREALSPQELASFQDSISSLAASQQGLVADDSLDTDAVSQLLSQHVEGMLGEGSAAYSSQMVVDEDEPVVNQSIVQEVVEASQGPFSQELSSSMDKEMINILAGLAEESSQPSSQAAALSQSILLDQGDALSDDEAEDVEELSEAEESIVMSQRVWDDIEHHSPGSGDEQAAGEQGSHEASQRASIYNLEGMSDTWIGSFLGGDIPQLDGAADDDSSGQEDLKMSRKRLGMGKTRNVNRVNTSSKASDASTRRDVPLTTPGDSKTSEMDAKRGKTKMTSKCCDVVEESEQSVWPQKGKAIRTYSRKGMSALKFGRSPPFDKEKAQKKDKKKAVVVNTEDVRVRVKEGNCEDTFRLVLSDSEDNDDSSGVNLRSQSSDVATNQQNKKPEVEQVRKTKPSTARKDKNTVESKLCLEGKAIMTRRDNIKPEVQEISKIETSSVLNEQGISHGYTPEITKYFPSPGKKTEDNNKRKQRGKQLSNVSQESPSCKTLDMQPLTQQLPSCSSQQETYSRKATLRKRKLSEVEKKERKLSKGASSRWTKQNSDLVASLSVISGAMSNLKVSLEDVSQSTMLNLKFGEARTRLRNRLEMPRQSYTRIVNQGFSSPVRKERHSPQRSPLLSRKNERSPLPRKRTSPKRKDERMKKYGTLPVVIAKSPKKSSAGDAQFPEGPLASQQSETETNVLTSQISQESALCTDLFSGETGYFGPGIASSRSRTRGSVDSNSERCNRLTELSSSGTISVACSSGDEETSRRITGSFLSRELSPTLPGRSGNKPRRETGRILSLQRKGLKRKLVVDSHKHQTLVSDLPCTGKKRKLSLKLKASSLRTEGDVEALVTPGEAGLVEEKKSICGDQDKISSPRHISQLFSSDLHGQSARVNVDYNDRLSGFDNKKDFALSKGLLDDITCVPSSPGEPVSSDEISPKCAKSSPTTTESNSLPVLTKADASCDKSQDSSDADVSTKSELETPHNVSGDSNNAQPLSQEDAFPKEKDTELLANALFNMSFPSPLPCGEECFSPPCPSSPLDTKTDVPDLRDQHKDLKGNEALTLSSSIVEKDDASEVESHRSSAISSLSSLNHAQQTGCFSPAVSTVQEEYAVLPLCPQLGETQSPFENTSSENDDCVGQKIRVLETTRDKESYESYKSLVNRGHSSTSEGDVFMEESMMEENVNSDSDSRDIISENKLCESTTVRGNEPNESSSDLMSHESVRTRTLETKVTDLTEFTEADESSISSAAESEFVLKFSTEDENSTDGQVSVQSNLNDSEMEIFLGEDNDNQVQEDSLKSLPHALADAVSTESAGECKDQTSSALVSQRRLNCTSVGLSKDGSLGSNGAVAIKPLKRPPTSEELLNSLKDHGLPQCKYQRPFCSNPDDIPALPREVGGRVLRIESKEVSSLPEFESSSSLQGVKHWRMVMSSAHECAVQTIDDAANLHKNVELKIALMGNGDVVVTPCRGPPSPEAVKAWAREKLAKQNLKAKKQREDIALKKLERRKEPSSGENLEKVRGNQVSEHQKIDVKVSRASVTEFGFTVPATPVSKITSPKVTKKLSSPSLATDVELVVGKKQTELVDVEGENKRDVMELSDSSSPVEVTSPRSLFSPNEGKIFTFASTTETEVELCRSHDQNEILDTELMSIECHDGPKHLTKVSVTSGASSVTVTPSILQSPEQTPSSTQQPLSPLLQTQNPVFTAPYHSTPVATKLVFGVQSPRCTPISDATTKKKRLNTNNEPSAQKNAGNQASSDQTPSLRQQLLASQFKFVTPGVQPRRSMPWNSQIEGPSPNNTYGFKIPQMNLQDAKALHEVQHLTLFSLELHIRTRRDIRPDPEFDPICAIFYYIQTDTPLPSGKNKVTGIICVDSESANISTSETESKERSFSSTENTTKLSLYRDAVASTSTSNISMSKTSQNASWLSSRTYLSRSGVTNYEVQYVTEEKDLFPALLLIIRKWDPDILIGYEVQMFSWGFLLERALTFEIDLCTRLSRIKGSSSDSNMDAEKDRWGAAHTSEIKIAGRIILNVWRLMRHEVALSSYSFENVAFHVLHERIPLFTFRTLSDWWDHRTALNRWRTVDHYVRRCHGNIRILESVDFIGRTSELARLFGILFFSVISRGSQYRVESMMLRIAKPMNYIPVSPSVEQRGAMRAPETIPLVMEPESRFYSDPVLVLDFQSLYPSMIIAYNYCFSTCLGRVSCLSEFGEFKFGATSLSVPPSLLKKLEGDIHICPNGVAFVKSSVRRGILPSMLDEILQTRIMVKTSMKRWKADKSLERMLDARQLGLKLIANVTFGYTSAHFSGRMPCVEIGDSIVRKARETLERAIDLVNNTPRWGARVVYGDTDSLFVLLKGVTKEQAFSIGKDIVDTVTAMNPKPVKLKFEKVYLPCVLQTKKRYVGYMYETIDQKEPVFDAKGIETVRRDSCPAVAKILEKSLRVLFETRDLSLVKKFVQRQCTKLMEGRASIQDFTFAKEYRGMKNYKPGACVPALELTRRMLREDRRSEPRVGERVPYVVVYGSPGLPLIQLVRRPYEVLQDPSLRLNASYYITKQILPPLNRVFSLIGMDVFTWYADLPRVVRVAQMHTDPGERKKGTISQYFSTMTCPVCQELTPTDLCAHCRARPQLSAVTLINRMRSWERAHQHLEEICYSCCGSRDTKLSCVSLSCPVFYKLVQCTRDLKSSQNLRMILESF